MLAFFSNFSKIGTTFSPHTAAAAGDTAKSLYRIFRILVL